jgi:NADH:ubiquinone oxidoreductase subunit E
MIDDRLYEHVTPEIVDTILDAVRTQKEKVS